jgi:Mg2+ and Co2+ transporter CorA
MLSFYSPCERRFAMATKNYVVCINGSGEGCDYTIDCNVTFKYFTASCMEEIVDWIRNNITDYYGSDRIESYRIFEIIDEVTDEVVNIIAKEEQKEAEKEKQEKEEEKKQDELRQLAALKQKYENK